MRYIRILRAPQRVGNELQTKVTIESDLGDSYMTVSLQVIAFIENECKDGQSSVVMTRLYSWEPHQRVLDISFRIPPRAVSSQDLLCVGVYPKNDNSLQTVLAHDGQQAANETLTSCVGARSAAFSLQRQSLDVPRLQRKSLALFNGSTLTIWEEILPEIIGKVWDAGFTAVNYFNRFLASQSLQVESMSNISVLELGSGTGVFGLFLAATIPHCTMTLTDLQNGRDLIQRNIAALVPAEHSSAAFQELEWGKEPPVTIQSQQFDLVVLTDCTYNPDNAQALVKTINSIRQTSPNVIIMFVSKQRHETEDIFLELMEEASFSTLDRFAVPIPTDENIAGLQYEQFYQRFGGDSMDGDVQYVWFTICVSKEQIKNDGSLHKPSWLSSHILEQPLKRTV